MQTMLDIVEESYQGEQSRLESASTAIGNAAYEGYWAASGTLGIVVDDDRMGDNPINRDDPTGLKTIVVAFSGLDGPAGPGSKWIEPWEAAAKKGGFNGPQDVDYKEYTWQQVQKAYDETIKDLTTQQQIPGVDTKNVCVRNTLVVLGHSFGGDAAYKFVQKIGKKVLVSNVVTADPRHFPGIPPFDTIPFDEPSSVFHWENFHESQQWLVPPFELFGAPVKGPTATDNFIELPNASTAHYDIPSDQRVLAAVTAAVRDAGTYETF